MGESRRRRRALLRPAAPRPSPAGGGTPAAPPPPRMPPDGQDLPEEWPTPTPLQRLRGVVMGWLLMAATSGVMVLFLTLDWPLLGLLVCLAFAMIVGGLWLNCGPDGWAMFFLLAFAVVVFQLPMLETRISPRALLQPSGMLVSTEGLQVHPYARSITLPGFQRGPVRVRVAPVAPPGWAPGQPVPYWVTSSTGRAPQAAWIMPQAWAVMAPPMQASDARGLAREMAAEWGSPMSSIPFFGAPVLIVWAEDPLALAEGSRAWFLRVLLLGMAVWPVLLAGSWAVAVIRGWRRRGDGGTARPPSPGP